MSHPDGCAYNLKEVTPNEEDPCSRPGPGYGPRPHRRRLRAGRLAVGEVVERTQLVVVAELLVLAAVRRDEVRGPDERNPTVR